MDSIFSKPALASEAFHLGEQTFTLYELSGDLYNQHILSVDAVRAWHQVRAKKLADADKEAQEPNSTQPDYDAVEATESDAVDYNQIYQNQLDGYEDEYLWVACALVPGYPDKTVEELLSDLKRNITLQTLSEMFQVVVRVNKLTLPKPDTPEPDSFTD